MATVAKPLLCAALAASFLAPASVQAGVGNYFCVTGVWENSDSGLWAATEKWTNGILPGMDELALLPESTSAYSVTVQESVVVADVRLGEHSTLRVLPGASSVVTIGGCEDECCGGSVCNAKLDESMQADGVGTGLVYDGTSVSEGHTAYDISCATGYVAVGETTSVLVECEPTDQALPDVTELSCKAVTTTTDPTTPTTTPTTAETVEGVYASVSHYCSKEQELGLCEIETPQGCEAAAIALGFPDVDVEVVANTGKVSGCSIRGTKGLRGLTGTLVFNKLETQVRDGFEDIVVLCEQCEFASQDYACDGEQFCTITSAEACEEAAQALGKEQTVAATMSKTTKPPGCWTRRNGKLVFNDELGSGVELQSKTPTKDVLCQRCQQLPP